jgi:hypothetical protein
MAIYQARTGRSVAPSVPFKEAALICGRRAGKSHITAFLASCLAMRDYKPFLAAGEIATIAILASDRKQSRAIFRFIGGLLKGSSLLEGLRRPRFGELVVIPLRPFCATKLRHGAAMIR